MRGGSSIPLQARPGALASGRNWTALIFRNLVRWPIAAINGFDPHVHSLYVSSLEGIPGGGRYLKDEQYGEGNREVVQCAKGLRIHPAR
jgi:hypothetical protein